MSLIPDDLVLKCPVVTRASQIPQISQVALNGLTRALVSFPWTVASEEHSLFPGEVVSWKADCSGECRSRSKRSENPLYQGSAVLHLSEIVEKSIASRKVLTFKPVIPRDWRFARNNVEWCW